MPHYFPGEIGWVIKLDLTNAEVGVYTKIMPWILLYLWSRVGELKGAASSMPRGEDSYVNASGILVVSRLVGNLLNKSQHLRPSVVFQESKNV